MKISPCNAVMKRVKNTNCDINTMNDLCYGISSAYGDIHGSELKKELDRQCAELISEKKCVLGKTDCYMKRPVPPPIFNQVPHFFPKLLKESGNPQKAYNMCCSMCDNTKYPNSCKDKCNLDSDAVVVDKKPIVESYKHRRLPSRGCYSVMFCVGFAVVLPVIILLVCLLHAKN